MESILRRGEVVPMFTLPDTAGNSVRRGSYRGRQHLLLVFLPSAEDDGARAYLRALADSYPTIRATSAEVLAVLRGDAEAARAAKAELELPFPLLLDQDGAVTARFIPATARAAALVTDRYGELYYAAPAADTHTLPPSGELQSWLEAIDNQCVI